MPTVTEDSPESMENTQSPRLEVFKGLLFGIGNLVVLYTKILTICRIRKIMMLAGCF